MLPCVLLTLNIFFPFSLHTSILSAISPFFLSQLDSRVYVRRAYHWFSRDLWEKCHSAVQLEDLFRYQTSTTNFCGVNLNISVSCRLPHRKGTKYSPYILLCLKKPDGSAPTATSEKKTYWGGKSMDKWAHVRILVFFLKICSFSTSTRHVWGAFVGPQKRVKAGFPMHKFIWRHK